jgi:betaine lipid synthase
MLTIFAEPWYIRVFGECGFSVKRVAVRVPGSCIDRVNMYASKTSLVELKLEAPALRME